jgi:hypothetical protein
MVLHTATNVLYRVKSTFLKLYFLEVFVTCNLLVDYFFNLWALSQDTLTNIFQTLRLDAAEGYDKSLLTSIKQMTCTQMQFILCHSFPQLKSHFQTG